MIVEADIYSVMGEYFGSASQKLTVNQVNSGQVNTTFILMDGQQPKGVLRRTSKPLENIKFETALNEALVDDKFPTPSIIKSQGGLPYVEREGVRYQLFDYITGQPLEEPQTTQNHLYLIGKGLSKMHNTLGSVVTEAEPSFEGFGRFKNILERVDWAPYVIEYLLPEFIEKASPYLQDGELVASLCRDTIIRAKEGVNDIYHNLPKHPIHGDFTRENLLFAPNLEEIAGVIDFDDAHVDPRVFDPVISAIYFAVVGENFLVERANYIFKGYSEGLSPSRPLSDVEVQAIPRLTELYSLFASLWTINAFNNNPNHQNLDKASLYHRILSSVVELRDKNWVDVV